MSDVPAIDVEQLREMMQSPTPPFVLDVREPREAAICVLPGSTLIPLGSLPERLAEVPKDRMVVVHCHHGGRSSRAVGYLREQGYAKAFNLKGGIHAWAERIDSEVKTYG
jgi:rhodanese-related sulfurtransferase